MAKDDSWMLSLHLKSNWIQLIQLDKDDEEDDDDNNDDDDDDDDDCCS